MLAHHHRNRARCSFARIRLARSRWRLRRRHRKELTRRRSLRHLLRNGRRVLRQICSRLLHLLRCELRGRRREQLVLWRESWRGPWMVLLLWRPNLARSRTLWANRRRRLQRYTSWRTRRHPRRWQRPPRRFVRLKVASHRSHAGTTLRAGWAIAPVPRVNVTPEASFALPRALQHRHSSRATSPALVWLPVLAL